MRRPKRSRSIASMIGLLAAATALAVAMPANSAATGAVQRVQSPASSARFSHSGGQLTLTESVRSSQPGYSVKVQADPFQVTTQRAGRTVLATTDTTSPSTGAVVFAVAGTSYAATRVIDSTWNAGQLTLTLATTNPSYTVTYAITPRPGSYQINWTVQGATADTVGQNYQLASAGHWYGQGEAMTPGGGPYTQQPWPLDSGQVIDDEMGPSSYLMTDPFWFTSSSAGLWVDTGNVMDVAINQKNNGLGSFAVTGADSYQATVFVARTPRSVYQDYIAITGTPASSNAVPSQYQTPLWNDWGQMYTSVDESKILAYAKGLAANHVPGHAIQIDDGWMSHYGDFTFNSKFPTPKAMSAEIHKLGFNLGLWVTLWINKDANNFSYAKSHGYLLKSKADPSQVCLIPWWDGPEGAGIVDLANPAARNWFAGELRTLESTYDVSGFKFDTRFFDPSCQPDPGTTATSYIKLGAQFVKQFNQQGVGVRIHWTGSQQNGFVTREIDKSTDFGSLQAGIAQALAISTIGYPFVETDMIGGSDGGPTPTKDVLIRWAQAAALMPLMYSSTSPADGNYDAQTVNLYKAAIRLHEGLASYIQLQVKRAVATDEPIMKPIFFDFPGDTASYTDSSEWLLGDSLLAAPVLASGTSRTVQLPAGRWYDVLRHRIVHGSTTLSNYHAGLGQVPMFVRLGTQDTGRLISAVKSG